MQGWMKGEGSRGRATKILHPSPLVRLFPCFFEGPPLSLVLRQPWSSTTFAYFFPSALATSSLHLSGFVVWLVRVTSGDDSFGKCDM